MMRVVIALSGSIAAVFFGTWALTFFFDIADAATRWSGSPKVGFAAAFTFTVFLVAAILSILLGLWATATDGGE